MHPSRGPCDEFGDGGDVGPQYLVAVGDVESFRLFFLQGNRSVAFRMCTGNEAPGACDCIPRMRAAPALASLNSDFE